MRNPVLIFVLFLGLPTALGAQTQQGSWSNVNRLKAGQGIEVIESSMKRHAGKFVTVTDELLTLKENGSDGSVKREDVACVSTSSGPKRGSGRRRAPRPHNRLPCLPCCRLALDDISELLLPLSSRLSQAVRQGVAEILLWPKNAVYPAAAFEQQICPGMSLRQSIHSSILEVTFSACGLPLVEAIWD